MTRPTPLKDISVEEVRALLAIDAILVDVRETHEQAAERIPGAVALPLSDVARGEPANLPMDRAVVFLCASGARTRNNAAALAAVAGSYAFCMSGGIAAWKRAGLPVERG
jgi:rhodanese-related sulfurtransferase